MEDITFCSNENCKITVCMRNPKNIKNHDIPHSFADLDGNTNYCLKVKGVMPINHGSGIIRVPDRNDFRSGASCLLCGAFVEVPSNTFAVVVCEDCKALWKKLKEKEDGRKDTD